MIQDDGIKRTFETGATRDTAEGKIDYEGILSPLVLERFGQYMHAHRVQSDGTLRDSDNWTKGMPRREYMRSMWRHFMDVWYLMRGHPELSTTPNIEDALCALLFNVMGLLHEILERRNLENGP